MLKFAITLYGIDEHSERNVAQKLWHAIEREHAKHQGNPGSPMACAMLIGEAEYATLKDDPPMSGRDPAPLDDHRDPNEIEMDEQFVKSENDHGC
jgi:hypothetical protein